MVTYKEGIMKINVPFNKLKSIVHIARKYGGGGHALACGCTLQSFDEVDDLLADLDQYIESGEVVESS